MITLTVSSVHSAAQTHHVGTIKCSREISTVVIKLTPFTDQLRDLSNKFCQMVRIEARATSAGVISPIYGCTLYECMLVLLFR